MNIQTENDIDDDKNSTTHNSIYKFKNQRNTSLSSKDTPISASRGDKRNPKLATEGDRNNNKTSINSDILEKSDSLISIGD